MTVKLHPDVDSANKSEEVSQEAPAVDENINYEEPQAATPRTEIHNHYNTVVEKTESSLASDVFFYAASAAVLVYVGCIVAVTRKELNK